MFFIPNNKNTKNKSMSPAGCDHTTPFIMVTGCEWADSLSANHRRIVCLYSLPTPHPPQKARVQLLRITFDVTQNS